MSTSVPRGVKRDQADVIREYAIRAVAEAPPLTREQLARIAALLAIQAPR